MSGCCWRPSWPTWWSKPSARCTTRWTGDPLVLPIELILTEQSDDEVVLDALRAELDGGPATGFSPSLDEDGRVLVSFTNTVVQATRP